MHYLKKDREPPDLFFSLIFNKPWGKPRMIITSNQPAIAHIGETQCNV